MRKKLCSIVFLLIGIVIGFTIKNYLKLKAITIEGWMPSGVGTWADLLSAIGTIGAVWVALWTRYDPERVILARKLSDDLATSKKLGARNNYRININQNIMNNIIGMENYIFADKVIENKEDIHKKLENISNNLKKLIKGKLLSESLKDYASDLIKKITEIESKNYFNKDDISQVIHSIIIFNNWLMDYWNEERNQVENINKKVIRIKKKYHIPEIYFKTL